MSLPYTDMRDILKYHHVIDGR